MRKSTCCVLFASAGIARCSMIGNAEALHSPEGLLAKDAAHTSVADECKDESYQAGFIGAHTSYLGFGRPTGRGLLLRS